MAIIKRTLVEDTPSQVGESPIRAPIAQNVRIGKVLSEDQRIVRSVAVNNVFQSGWFKDYVQEVSLENALKKGFEVAEQIEAWLNR